MFKVVAERRKRSVWTPRTIATSVVFHLLLLAGFVTAAETRDSKPDILVDEFPVLEPEQPKITRVDPPPPPPAAEKPDEPPPVKGRTLELQAPEKVPNNVPPPDLTAKPVLIDQYSGIGPLGNQYDPNATRQVVTPTPGPPGGGDDSLPDFEKPIVVEMADVKPELGNRRQAEMILQNNYPPMLRDAGVTGTTTVELIIDRDGKVEPGSVRVKDSSHDAFNQAAIRAVERFRFTPAQYHGRPVSVLVTLPIQWQLAQ
jgi:protein TonB